MTPVLQGKRVVLGVTGSIAAYKAVDFASRLVKAGALVDAVLTTSAAKLVTPLSFAAITHRPVVTDLFDPTSRLSMDHVALATEADAVVVAPATANTVAKLAHGIADSALAATVLATRAPVLVAPAGDAAMFASPATQANLQTLRDRGVRVIGPVEGRLASGLHGAGRLEEPERLIGHIRRLLAVHGDYAGRKVVVSAGGTRERIDPVRYLTNRSSGKMGHALAEAARDRGADVTLVTAATLLPDPVGVTVVRVESAAEMREALLPACENADLLLMAAAVADYRPAQAAGQKIKKRNGADISLELVENPDIIAAAAGERLVKVAFAAETQELVENARLKLDAKGASLIVANDVTAPGAGFDSDTNKATILDREGGVEDVPMMSKLEVAQRVLDRALPLLRSE